MIKIFTSSAPVLRKVSEPVKLDTKAKFLGEKLTTALKEQTHAYAVSANQVGAAQRMFSYNFNRINQAHSGGYPLKGLVVNPEIISFGSDTEVEREGCLSFPNRYIYVERPIEIHVRWYDMANNLYECLLDNMAARVFQHEIDHLNGVLMIDKETEDKLAYVAS